ncbi:hypothetical protein SteCoe_30960 [Stentor coeruleus]|uniref:Uncharacterized protein n=1 Tax=Stentor coeruleus TaxID=5963 RepID=A0A1R2B2H7_9CILI|nr:hypothetical protein SteCoe_30960 [Stentor coeruleus]
MSQDWVKYHKQIIDGGFRGFSYITKFINPISSLYQSLIIGILEIIQRFKYSPTFTEALINSLNEYIQKAENYAFNKNYSNQYLNKLKQIGSAIGNADLKTGFYYLNYYIKEQSSSTGSDIDYAMRMIICCIIENDIIDQANIIEGKSLIHLDQMLQLLSSIFSIKISIFEGNDEYVYVKNAYGNYPSLNLLRDYEGYGILYSDVMIEIENDINFDLRLVEYPPFIFSNKPKENYNVQDYKSYTPDGPSSRTDINAQRPSSVPDELKYSRHLSYPVPAGPCMPGISVEENFQLLKSKKLFQGPIINPYTKLPGIYKIVNNENSHNSSGNIRISGSEQVSLSIIDNEREKSKPPKLVLQGKSQTVGNKSVQGTIKNENYNRLSEISLQKKCQKCLEKKSDEDFDLIKCGEKSCLICNLCRSDNDFQCIICNRYYSNYENDLIKVIKLSKIN